MTDQSTPIARVDTRRRVTLPKEHATPGQIFLLEVDTSGIIRLTPAVAVPLDADGRPTIGTLGFNDPAAE